MFGLKKRLWATTITAGGLAAAIVLVLVPVASGRDAVGTATCAPHGILSLGMAGRGIPSLDPNTATFAGQNIVSNLVYPGLTQYASNGTGEVVPDLATKWKSSADQRTWWFWLRKNVRYSDGRQFTSADAVANILRVLTPTVGSPARASIKDFQSVDAIGKWEIRIKLGKPSAIVPAQLLQTRMADLTDPSKLNTVGTGPGPYRVQNFIPNESLTLVPNSYYVGPQQCFKKIVFAREPDPTSMVTDFTAKKLGLAWQIPLSAVPTVRADKSAYFISPKVIASAHVMEVDDQSPPFNNPLAREALSYAVDRQTIVKVAFQGLATAAGANDYLSTSNPGYDKALKPDTFNLAKAKQLFTEAGVKPGTTFTFWTQSGARPEWVTMGEILQQDLQKIGFNLKIEQNDYSTWHAAFTGRPFPAMIVPNFWSLQANPVLALSGPLSGNCHCNFNNPQYDALYLKALGTPGAGQQAVLDQMQAMLNNQVPEVIVAQQTNIVAAQKGIVGVWEDPAGDVHLETAHFAS